MIGIIGILDPTSWVFWFAAGAAFFAIEVLLLTILALGFGVGAWVASALIFFILPADVLSVPLVLVIWAILSAASWIVLRIIFRNKHSGNKAPDGDINEY